MRERGIGHYGQGSVWSLMFPVTMSAAQIRVVVHQASMQRGDILHLYRDLAVTICTAIGHLGRFPRRGVTSFAVPAGCGM